MGEEVQGVGTYCDEPALFVSYENDWLNEKAVFREISEKTLLLLSKNNFEYVEEGVICADYYKDTNEVKKVAENKLNFKYNAEFEKMMIESDFG